MIMLFAAYRLLDSVVVVNFSHSQWTFQLHITLPSPYPTAESADGDESGAEDGAEGGLADDGDVPDGG